MKAIVWVFVIVTLVIITSCEFTEIVTIEWEPDETGEFRQFSTNDRTNCGNFYVWIADSMTTVAEVELKKMTGYNDAGYGIVFCYQDSDNYYKLLITVEGRYMVNEVRNGVSRDPMLKSWRDGAHLASGWKTVNTVKVVHDGAGKFDIYFDGVLEDFFSVDPYFSNGSVGYYAVVQSADLEYFPYYPVDVRFKLLQPGTDPPPP